MHVEKNIYASVLGYIYKERDMVAVGKDMQAIGIWERLYLVSWGYWENYLKLHVPNSLQLGESAKFLTTIGAIQTPTSYSSITSRPVKKCWQGLRTHIHHELLPDTMSACICGFLLLDARDAITRLGHCYKSICTKAMNPAEMQPLHEYVAQTMCLLEIWFPPAFVDVIPHFIVHMVDEQHCLGLIHSRWRYGVEHYFFVLKQYVRNRSKPEPAIATGYSILKHWAFWVNILGSILGIRRYGRLLKIS